MVRVIRKQKLSQRLKIYITYPLFIPFLLLFLAILTVPIITFVTSRPVDIRQRAAGNPQLAAVVNDPILAQARSDITGSNVQQSEENTIWYMYAGAIVAMVATGGAYVAIVNSYNKQS